nr:hypothetical protein [uncultured Celeribacter sp.]
MSDSSRLDVSVSHQVLNGLRETLLRITAALAGAWAFFAAKANIIASDFQRSIQRISQDDDAGWCDLANGQIFNANDGSKHCAIHMPSYVEPAAE